MDHHQIARLLAALRVAAGVLLIVFPRRLGRQWVGPAGDRPEVMVLTRAMGARDAAIGAGALQALTRGEAVRPWLVAGIASDATDAFATVVASGRIGRLRALVVASTAVAAAVTGALVANEVDAG